MSRHETSGKSGTSRSRPLDAAIVGLACKYPGARDVETFWQNVLAGRDATSKVPPDRRDPAVFHDPAASSNDRVTCRRGGFLDAPIEFDPSRHGVKPLDVEGGEPEQLLVLDAARTALADAGYPDGIPSGVRVEVAVGRGNDFNRGELTRLQHGRAVAQTLAILRALHPDWTEAEIQAVRADLKASLPPFEAATVAGQLTNATAGRIADRPDHSGANDVVDAASASSLVALERAARSLAEGRCDLAVVGGVYLAVDVDFYQVLSLLGALSRSGVGRPFGAGADGMIPGEGVGVVILKRLREAEHDGNRVYAVVKGIGLASDGRGGGLAAPSARGLVRALRRAYRAAGIDPATVQLVEGHGLGVPAADRAELRALRAVFPRPEPEEGKRWLGAVSSMIGHAMPAAGMAGLIKTALALHHRVLPPTLHADEPHPLLTDPGAPFTLNGATRPWIHGASSRPRRAGVSASGFAGANAHAVLEEHPASADGVTPGWMTRWETEAILLGGPDRAGLVRAAETLLAWLDVAGNQRVDLKDLAATLNAGQGTFPVRAGLVVASVNDLRERLRWLLGRLSDLTCHAIRDARGTYYWQQPLAPAGRLALLYAGEGTQYPGMLADLCPHFPELRAVLDNSDRIARERGHARLPSEQLFGTTTDTSERSGLWAIGTAVNVVLSTQWAMQQVLTALGLRPDAVVGHSSGEILALTAAGAISEADLVGHRLGDLGAIFERLEEAGLVPGASLVAVAAPRDRVEAACREADIGSEVTVALDNCPHQAVIAGSPEAVDRAVGVFSARGLLCEALPFRRAYHTPAFAPALEPVRAFFEDLPLRTPALPVYTCSTAGLLPGDVAAIRQLAVEQWVRPVQFRATIEAMHADGVHLFVEVGARGNLTGYVEDTLRGRPHFAVAANLPRRSGPTQLNHLVASLHAQGVALRPAALYARRRPEPIDLSRDLPPRRALMELRVGFPEMRLSESLLAALGTHPPAGSNGTSTNGLHVHVTSRTKPTTNGHATNPVVSMPPVADAAVPPLSTAGTPDETLLDYFRTMDLFLETQRQVMEAYLQAPAPGSAAVVANPSSIDLVPIFSNAHLDQILESVPPSPPAVEAGEVLLDQVSRRTGYPREILDLDHDMEADLGIDSIKRVEILGELQQLGHVPDGTDLERLSRSRTLGEVVRALTPAERPAALPTGPRGWPGTVDSFTAGRELVATWPIDATTDPVAQQHTLGGRRISVVEPERLGLPVVPFTIMGEILAQAAVALVPGRRVLALRDVQARRWVPYESEPTVFEVRATCDPVQSDRVRVSLRPRAAKRDEVAFEGVVVLAPERPPMPQAVPVDFSSDRLCPYSAEELYRDQWLFHGPSLQALVQVGRSSPEGIEGSLRVLPHRELLPARLWPALHTDPVVLDAFTHLLGCWGIDKQAGPEGSVMFPLCVSEIAQFGEAPAVGTLVDCHIFVREITRHRVRVDAELVTPDERVWVRISGWEDWRFYWPDRYRDVFRAPEQYFAGEPVALEGEGSRALAVWLEPPADMGKPVWRDVLEWVQLGPQERAENRARGESEPALTLRIWGRTAAKEAARRLLGEHGHRPGYPADLVVDADPNGRPQLRSLAEPGRADLPAVSIAHTEGVAVALAALDPAASIGVDVETIRPHPEGFEAAALLDHERLWLDQHTTAETRDEWVARLWCCKEAAAKATGLGMVAGRASAEMVSATLDTGRIVVSLGSDLAGRRPDLAGARLVCHSARRGDFAWAWTTCERSSP